MESCDPMRRRSLAQVLKQRAASKRENTIGSPDSIRSVLLVGQVEEVTDDHTEAFKAIRHVVGDGAKCERVEQAMRETWENEQDD